MTAEELMAALRSAGVPDGHYEIQGRTAGGGHPADGSLYLDTDGDRWVVGGFERGRYTPDRYFDTEDEACRFVYRKLTRPRPAPVVLTPAEEERARLLNQERRAEIERRLAERERTDLEDDPGGH